MFEYVLILDSDVERRTFLYDIFTQLNYSVTTVPSSEGLIDRLKNERPACVVMDAGNIDERKEIEALLKKIREIDNDVVVLVLSSSLTAVEMENKISDKKVGVLKRDVEKPQLMQYVLKMFEKRNNNSNEGEDVSFKGNILIVDDEEESGELVKSYLSRRGYNVSIAFNGEEAILKVKSIKPKVVILDILMAGMDGLCVLKRIKEIDNSAFVIMSSGVQDEKVIDEAKQLGADAYLVKPFNLEKLEASILSSTLKKFKDKYSI
jgi:DNA-binding response OmpR family regulator